MQQATQIENSTLDIKIPEAVPAPGAMLPLLLPLLAPAVTYAVKAFIARININRKAEIEDRADRREYLQQQNELLLNQLLDRPRDPEAK